MTKAEAVEIILAARRAAQRSGGQFYIDRTKLHAFGLSSNDINKIETAVTRIETFVAGEMMALRD